MTSWHDDDELFSIMRRELFTAVIGDVLDSMGLHHQFLSPQLKPLHDDMIALGRGMPVLTADYFGSVIEGSTNPISQRPFGLMLEALDDLKRNEVYFTTGASPRYALWGELMSTRAALLGSTGAVLDGYARDTHGIIKLNFPTFSYGRYAQDSATRGKVVDFRIPVESDGVRVDPGDILFGDIDGVLVIPKAAEAEAINRALDKVRKENLVKTAIEQGMSAVEAFKTYGVM